MQADNNHTKPMREPRGKLIICAVLLLLLGADFILTPHAPLHHLPRVGSYMLVTLVGIGAVMALTRVLGWLLRRREDYYGR